MNTFKKIMAVVMVLAMLFAAGCGGNTNNNTAEVDKEVTIKCGLTFTLDDYRGQDLQYWVDLVKEKTNGTVKIELYPSETLVKGADAVPALVMGSIDMYLCTPSYLEGTVEGMEAMGMPCTAAVAELKDRLQLGYDFNIACEKLLEETFEKAGIQYIGTIAQGGYVDMVFNKPIRSAAEYTGFKVRTTGGLPDKQLKALGCTPTFISSSDLYLGLQTGVVDGAMTTPTTVLNNKLYELCPYMVVPSLSSGYSPYYVCCSNNVWEQLSANQQSILRSTAYETLARTVETYTDRLGSDRTKLMGLLKEYIELPADEWAKIAAKLQPVYDEEAKNFSGMGKQFYDLKLKIEGEWKPSN